MKIPGIFIVWVLTFLCAVSHAGDPCKNSGGILLAHANTSDHKSSFFACGTKDAEFIADVTVFSIQDAKETETFQSDDAFMRYRISTGKDHFRMEEGLNDTPFRPFLAREYRCSQKACHSTVQCIWKKESGKPKQSLFYQALNGDHQAADRLLKPKPSSSDASSSEANSTYAQKIVQLKKLGCL